MKSKIEIHAIEHHTPKWFAFRENGIGGSDISALLGLNPYRSAIEVFYEKIGVLERKEDNKNFFWGRMLEDKIAEVWQYVDGTDDGYITNYNEGKIIRKCRRVNGYVVNPDYPWLFYSADRLMNKGSVNLANGNIEENESVLEIKTANSFALNKWEDGIPPEYIAQPVQGTIIFELDYAETVIFDNLRNFQVFPIDCSSDGIKALRTQIIDVSKRFWYDKILPAKEIAKKEGFVSFTSQDTPAGIQLLEPEADNKETYKEFMSTRHRTDPEWGIGTEEQFMLAYEWKVYTKLIGAIKEREMLVKNKLSKEMINLEELRFDDLEMTMGGRVDNKLNRYEKLQINNRIKDAPNDRDLEELLNKIDFKEWFKH